MFRERGEAWSQGNISAGSRISLRRETPQGGTNIQFCQIFPKNCIKLKEFGPPGGACVPHAPLRSATENYGEHITFPQLRWQVVIILHNYVLCKGCPSDGLTFPVYREVALVLNDFPNSVHKLFIDTYLHLFQ